MDKKATKRTRIRYAITIPARVTLATIWLALYGVQKGAEYLCAYLEAAGDLVHYWTVKK